ncbi:hypothetical protein [Blastococcus sp. SYSU D01042]
MQIRRPLAALMTALALFGGGATLTACGDPSTPNEGTTDDDSDNTGGADRSDDEGRDDLPNNSDPEQDTEDSNDDSTDPD